MKKPRQALAVIIILATILPMLTLLIPVPARDLAVTPQQFRNAALGTTLFAVLHVGAAGLFWLGLEGFRERLWRAYRAICLGLVVLGLTQLQFPIFSVFDLWFSAWVVTFGGISMPGLAAGILLFLGIRSFAQVLNETDWRTSVWVIPSAIALGALGALLIPDTNRMEYMGAIAMALLSITSASLVLSIKRRTGFAYTNAMAWFFVSLVTAGVAVLMPTLFDAFSIPRGPILTLPHALAGIVFVKAGYAFTKIREY